MSYLIQEIVMNEDLYVLVMEGVNVVLGIQWLETLGAVTCNYRKLTMEFQHQGEVCVFTGGHSTSDFQRKPQKLNGPRADSLFMSVAGGLNHSPN